VVSAAGARNMLQNGERTLHSAIASSGFEPWLRDQCYRPRENAAF